MSDLAKKLVEWVGVAVVLGGALAAVGSMWINTEVERRMKELASNPAEAPAVVANTTKLESLEQGQARIETKVDAFSSQFLAYLERQAE